MTESTLLHELSQMIAEQIQSARRNVGDLIAERGEINLKIEHVGARIDTYEHIQELISKLEAK